MLVTRQRGKLGGYKHRALKLLRAAREADEATPQTGAGARAVCVSGLGAAIATACEVALWAEEHAGFAVSKTLTTFTKPVVDQMGGLHSNSTPEFEKRNVSGIKIVLGVAPSRPKS